MLQNLTAAQRIISVGLKCSREVALRPPKPVVRIGFRRRGHAAGEVHIGRTAPRVELSETDPRPIDRAPDSYRETKPERCQAGPTESAFSLQLALALGNCLATVLRDKARWTSRRSLGASRTKAIRPSRQHGGTGSPIAAENRAPEWTTIMSFEIAGACRS